jgi:hypothetical protein
MHINHRSLLTFKNSFLPSLSAVFKIRLIDFGMDGSLSRISAEFGKGENTVLSPSGTRIRAVYRI